MPSRLSIEEIRKYAKQQQGLLVTEQYQNSKTKMLWRCAKGHEWYAAADGIIHAGHWCPVCAGKVKKSIVQLEEYAESKGGKLLSKKYTNQKDKMLWQCALGHEWYAASGGMFQKGYWCPECSGVKKKTIELAQEEAKKHNGFCLSESYVSVHTDMSWKCSQGHTFSMRLNSILSQNQWCPECSKNKKRDIPHAQTLAEKFGGHCLSTEYINNKTNLKWECKYGHRWSTRLNSVVLGFWCPTCSAGLGERICKIYFETIFGDTFIKVRPDWLMSPNGYRLELDGYSAKLKLAFEHQGQQHYKDVKLFRSKYSVDARRDLDALKIELCRQRGITLIEIPEIPTLTHLENIKAFIKTACSASDYPLPPDFDSIQVDYIPAYQDNRFRDFQLMAAKKGGVCHVELGYVEKNKIEWECAKGHVWLAIPKVIRRGHWCPYCAQNARLTLQDFVEIAKSRGGLCIGGEYVNQRSVLPFTCSEGHKFTKSAGHVKHSGSWCNKCSMRYTKAQNEVRRARNNKRPNKLTIADRVFLKSYKELVISSQKSN